MDDVISLADMALVYEVTDPLGVDRERLRVELTKEDPGHVQRAADGTIEIVLPLTTPVHEWRSTLEAELQKLVSG